MEYKELLAKRRSIRNFTEEEPPLESILEILNESCLAPSSSNSQPWRYIIITNRELIRKLSDESKRNLLKRAESDPGYLRASYRKLLSDPGFNVYYNAPCLIFIVTSETLPLGREDCALAAAYIMFSACERGLGTCWVDFGSHIEDRELLEEIGVTEGLRIIAPIVIGCPRRVPDVPQRSGPEILNLIT